MTDLRTPPDAPAGPGADAAATDVRIEHHDEPLGIGERSPRLSWRAAGQKAYEARVTDPASGEEWSSGRVESGESLLVPWVGPALASRDVRHVAVRVWREDGPTAWSAPVVVEAGLLEADDWTASLVSPPEDGPGDADQPPALFRREFDVRGEVTRARLYSTAHGIYTVELNGAPVGDHVLAPGWTSYRHRLRYQTYDVTALVRAGVNAIGATVADGWFRGRFGFEGGVRNIYGEHIGLVAQLELHYADGSVDVVRTDDAWRTSTGPTTVAGLYDGETHDARAQLPGWSRPGYDDASWSGVRVQPAPVSTLVAPTGPPVRRIEELAPVETLTSPSGRTIVDFGQNLVGRVRLRVEGPAGTTVTLRHAEVLEHGELGTRPLRQAAATDRYVLRGDGPEEWEPDFTFHGFRYVEVDGWPGELAADSLRAVVLHSDLRRTGWFECSDQLVNRLHENVVWGMRGNFVDVPTDCPQRDERLGWTGDIQVFTPTASFLYDVTGLLSSWLEDLAVEQVEVGTVPIYVPYIKLAFPLAPTAAWGDAAVVVPWVLYQRTGDAAVLERQYPSMTAWVDQVAELAGDDHLWNSGMQLGDWLDPSAPPERPAEARTDRYLVATAYLAWSARLLSESAAVLGRDDDAHRYGQLADAVRDAFVHEYVSPSGRVVSDAPTAYALAICFDLLSSDEQRRRAGERLVELVKADDHRIGTGFVGTPIICDALSMVGAYDTAYHLLLQEQNPSWLYSVSMGATTIWERWDSMLPDGSINPGEMTSFNHYALGAVADWLHRTVAGLALDAPGYRRILVAPRPGGGLSHAAAAHETPFGRAEVGWVREGGRLDVDVRVPAGTTAVIRLPDPTWDEVEVGPGAHRFSCGFRPVEEDPAMPKLGPFGQPLD